MHLDINELIWSIINFLILLAILYKFLYNPILRVFDKRREEIHENLSHAESSKQEAEDLLQQHRARLKKAEGEAQEIINSANKRAEETKNQILAEARQEAGTITRRAQEDIEREKERALEEVRDEIATLAVMAAGRVIDKNISKEDHEKMVQDFVSEVRELQ